MRTSEYVSVEHSLAVKCTCTHGHTDIHSYLKGNEENTK